MIFILFSALFTKIQDQLLIFTSYNLTEVDSDEACARYCNTIDGCLSFDYCPTTKSMVFLWLNYTK